MTTPHSDYSFSQLSHQLGDVVSDRQIDGEVTREKAMEPITAAVVIVAIWAPIHVGISKWVAEL